MINSGVTDKYKLMVVVENVQDAYDLVKACERIKSVNLGGSKIEENRRKLDTRFVRCQKRRNRLLLKIF